MTLPQILQILKRIIERIGEQFYAYKFNRDRLILWKTKATKAHSIRDQYLNRIKEIESILKNLP